MLDSKTVLGLLILLGVVLLLVFTNKLSSEAVDILKYIASSYMAVRVAANIGENIPKK